MKVKFNCFSGDEIVKAYYDIRLKELIKKIRFVDTNHELELSQKNWKIECKRN